MPWGGCVHLWADAEGRHQLSRGPWQASHSLRKAHCPLEEPGQEECLLSEWAVLCTAQLPWTEDHWLRGEGSLSGHSLWESPRGHQSTENRASCVDS